MENRSGEQLQSLTTIPNLLPIGQQDPLTLIPLQPNPTLAPLNPTNPTEQQILSIITGDNPDGAFQTVAKYSSTPLSPSPLTTQPPLYPLPFTLSPNSSHTPTPTPDTLRSTQPLTLEQLSRVESTAVNLWQSLLPDHRQLDVNFQITDLTNGEIARAAVTKFSPTGLATGGTILIDRNAQGAGWFVDATPLDWSEFTPLPGGSLQAKPDTAAAGKYDLFTALLHELGHISGFGHSDTTFEGQQIALTSDNNHLANPLYANDLMASELQIGERRLPSELDIALTASPIIGEPQAYFANLSGTVGIANGDFSINNKQDANYGWQTNGATTISNGIATLSDTSRQLANLTQKFLIPPNATKLQFTIKNSQLRIGQPNATPTPDDVFEVALFDAQMNPLAGKAQGLSNTDSLLNLQADGTVYFSDKVQIGGIMASGGKIANTDERTVTIDLAGIAGNTAALLYFDLLSFGSGESHISVDHVKIFTTTQLAPHLDNANLATNQATGLNIPLPTGVTLDSIELGTLPQHGTVVRNPTDGTITYTPNRDYVGTDSFTYLGFDSNGQVSNPATINITINNIAPTIDSIVIPTTVKEGQNIPLQATATDGGSSNNLTYSWNFGDGSSPISGRDITHTYKDNGNYHVILTVTDKDGGTTQQTSLIEVDNVTPTVNIIAPITSIERGSTLNFGVNYSDAGINDTHTITWNFGDGSSPLTGITNPSHIFTTAGTKNVSVTITDNDGASTTQSVQIFVTGIATTINSVDIPTNINEGQLVQLTATATGDGALTYHWYINNSTTPIVGQLINYAFADNGVYPVKLNVIDSNSVITTQIVNVTVNNVAPIIISIIKPTQINEGEPVLFKAIATDTGANDLLTYIWNFGDSTPTVSGQNVTHTFVDNGDYNVVLTVTDKDGAFATQTVAVRVDNVAPIIGLILKPATIKEGELVEFKATAIDVGINDTLTYSWNFGDSTPIVSGQNVNHTFIDNGNYNVVLTVTDKDGAVTIQNVLTSVDNVAPTIVSIVKPPTIKEGESVQFKATAIDVGINDTLTYSWNFGDSTPIVSGQNVNHTFVNNGDYNIVLTVTDKDGAVTTQTVTAKVDKVAPLPTITINDPTITEGNSGTLNLTFTLTLSQASTQTVSLTYNTSNITALAGSDYTATSGSIAFAAGETTKTITINILGDTIAESTETFALNLTNPINATISNTQSTATILDNDTIATPIGIRSGGTVSISGSANLDGNINSRIDDTHIYAAVGVNLTGSITIPVKRDSAGKPLKDASGKFILEPDAITVAPGGSTSSLSSKYSNIGSLAQTITIPTYTDTKQLDFLSKIPATGVITYDIGLNPIANTAAWNTKFPPAGTSTNPTVVRIINGSLNLPANINLSNYIIIVENGNINFSQGNPLVNNVTLIANAGNINLKSVKATALSLSASGDINFSGANQLTGNNIINSNGNTHFEGSNSMTTAASQVKIVAQGNIEISGNTSLKGQLWTKKNFSASGSTTIVGAITAMDNVDISGNSTITA